MSLVSLIDQRCQVSDSRHDNSRSGRGLSAGILIKAILNIELQHDNTMSLAPLIIKPCRPQTDARMCFEHWTHHGIPVEQNMLFCVLIIDRLS